MALICCLKRVEWVRVTAWYLVVHLLQCFLNEAWEWDETRVGRTREAVRKKKIYTYVLTIVLWQIFKPFINLLQCNVILVGKKYVLSNFLDFLYLAWLSRYKGMIENNFSHQRRKTSGCRACDVYVWWPESDFTWWQTEWKALKCGPLRRRFNAKSSMN